MTRVAMAVRSRARRAGRVALAASAAALLLAPATSIATAAGRAGAKGPSPDQVYRRVARAAYGPGGVEVSLILMSPDYLRITNQADAAAQYKPKRNFLFFLVEHHHNGVLGAPLRLLLRIDGGTPRPPVRTFVTLRESHHRGTVLVYPRASRWSRLELIVPPARESAAPAVLTWTRADDGGARR
jgi:hypothetical protein